MTELEPPRKSVELEDPGAHELESSEGEEHFSDASEGRKADVDINRSNATSPVPMTRVEKVDDEPSYGEVPGTAAYNMRAQDAVPDEVEIVPEGTRSRSASWLSASDRPPTPRSPGGTPIPITVVEKVDPSEPSHGDVPGTAAYEMRQADAVPDVILKAPELPKKDGSPTTSDRSEPLDEPEPEMDYEEQPEKEHEVPCGDDTGQEGDGDNNNIGDDFDDFEEGAEGDDFGDDFGDFDDGFQTVEGQDDAAFEEPAPPPPVSEPTSSLLQLDLDGLKNDDDIFAATQQYIEMLFPPPDLEQPVINTDINPSLLSERSLSLWAQLVAPPPLQPPNWVRSRIRRLFLVSLGVPVDLDEILPASKQKKLVLPSINIPGDRSPRASSDERTNGALSRLKREENGSSTSVDSSTSKVERKRRGPPPPPELDISSTTMLCSTTDAALNNFTNEELKAHVSKLEELQKRADEVLLYWVKRKESAIGDKEAFEAVIANLVEHAKKVRK